MLTKENGKIAASITSTEQIDVVDILYVNGIRFNRETDYQRGVRLRVNDPKTGHVYTAASPATTDI